MVWPLNTLALDSIHPDIRPSWNFRYFSKAGVLLNLVIQFARQRANIRETVIKGISTALKDSPVLPVFQKLPGIAPIEEGLSALRDGAVPKWNVDVLRALGLQMASQRGHTNGFIGRVFELSRTNPHNMLPQKEIEECKLLLLN